MRISVPVVDFGEIIVEPSPDNPGNIRVTINDDVSSSKAHSDLDNKELSDLIDALSMILKRRDK